jgi:ABC-type nickel/cobalt efflux system permease component RcnA
LCVGAAWSHDIPNERVDRSIQVTVRPGLLQIDYEVSLTELTLTQDLRALSGTMPGADRASWLARYAQVTGPLDAKGLLVSVDDQPVRLSGAQYDLVVEEHPRYTFHFTATIPNHGRLSVRDRNYVSSEGTSRLAVRGRDGVRVTGDELPEDVDQIPIRSVVLLSDEEERRTKQVNVRFEASKQPSATTDAAAKEHAKVVPARAHRRQQNGLNRLSSLLDEAGARHWFLLWLLALAIGAAHTIQPGHGKSLVTAVALGPQARLYQPVLLGIATTLSHTASVFLIALCLWLTGAVHVGTVHRGLTQVAGFVIAAAGFWRIGRYLGGHGEHRIEDFRAGRMSDFEVIGLGIAGGLVPCWDAVGLVVLAATLGRVAEGVGLVLAFSAGMAIVLIAAGALAWIFKSKTVLLDRAPKWQRRLGLACGTVLVVIGLYLFLQN